MFYLSVITLPVSVCMTPSCEIPMTSLGSAGGAGVRRAGGAGRVPAVLHRAAPEGSPVHGAGGAAAPLPRWVSPDSGLSSIPTLP